MTASSGSPAILPPTIESWVAADRALAAGRMRNLTAPTVVLASPLTDAFDFTGPDDVATVFAAAFEVLDDVDVARITLFMRPVASAAELLAVIGPALARRGLMAPGPAKAASALGRMPAMQLHMAEKRILPRLRPRR